MRLWIVSVGEPLPVDGENVRLRRMGNLAMYASTHGVEVEWFSVSFEHYKKFQRFEEDTDYEINAHFCLHLVKVNGYKRNVSVSRIIHHINAGKRIKERMGSLEKPDIIFASMEPLEVSKAAVSYAKENNVPCIVDVRDLWPEIYYDVIPQKLHFLLDIYVKHCKKKLCYTMSNCDSIVGLSQGFLNYGLKYAGREQQRTDAIYPISYPNYNYSEYAEKFEGLIGYDISELALLVETAVYAEDFVSEEQKEKAGTLYQGAKEAIKVWKKQNKKQGKK